MAKVVPRGPAIDRWVVACFALSVLALASNGLMTPASLTQSQIVDVAAAILGITGAVALGAVLAGRWVGVPRTRLGFAWTAFLGWSLIAAVVSGRGWAALMGVPTSLVGWFAFAAMVSIALSMSLRGGAARDVLEVASPWVLVLEIVFVFIWLVQSLGTGAPDLGLVARGTLQNSTGLGEVAVLLLPWMLVSPSSRPIRAPRVLRMVPAGRWAVALVTVGLLMFSGARAALVVALLWLVWVGLGRTKLSPRIKTGVIAGLIMAASLVAVGYVGLHLRDTGDIGALGRRPELWRTGAKAVEASPILGFGPDGFLAGGTRVSTPEFVSRTNPLVFMEGATDPHNLLVWVVVSTGLVGLGLFLWALTEVVLAWRVRAKAGVEIGPGAWAVGGSLAVFLTAPASIEVLPLFALILGVSVAARPRTHVEGPRKIAGYALLAVLATASVLMTANALTRAPFERTSAEVSPRLAPGAQGASDIWGFDPRLAYLAGLHWDWRGQTDPTVSSARPDLLALQRAATLDRTDSFAAFEYARLLAYYQMPAEQVDEAFSEVFRRWPIFPMARVVYAEYLGGTGRTPEAKQQLAVVQALQIDDAQLAAALESAQRAAGVTTP